MTLASSSFVAIETKLSVWYPLTDFAISTAAAIKNGVLIISAIFLVIYTREDPELTEVVDGVVVEGAGVEIAASLC